MTTVADGCAAIPTVRYIFDFVHVDVDSVPRASVRINEKKVRHGRYKKGVDLTRHVSLQ